MLTQFERSYALELSRSIGLSQQAILKQLEMLERANLVTSIGFVPSSVGAKRKLYEPTGFSTLIVDYGRNFLMIQRIPLENDSERVSVSFDEAISKLESIQHHIEELTKKRTELVKKKDELMAAIKYQLEDEDPITREIVLEYLNTFDVEEVSRRTALPLEIVLKILKSKGIVLDEGTRA
ncbi:hypothetical protein [Thermoplasma volcanium GSS1]|uniref:HTH arsR-type domain-containing protein n=2 Tax=Thermoplasma volcanium TaxID=50339 RepID=Q979Z7_THEVO|nr:hypothetical protein [Thermoplasma volcanium GSS1]